MVKSRRSVGGSSNGRTADSGSVSRGSNPLPPASSRTPAGIGGRSGFAWTPQVPPAFPFLPSGGMNGAVSAAFCKTSPSRCRAGGAQAKDVENFSPGDWPPHGDATRKSQQHLHNLPAQVQNQSPEGDFAETGADSSVAFYDICVHPGGREFLTLFSKSCILVSPLVYTTSPLYQYAVYQ